MTDPIDIVYLWCDGDEPSVAIKRQRLAAEKGIALKGKNGGVCRYRDNGELRYALRSVELFAPWIRRVHLVIDDDQTPPSWLDLSYGKLNVVRHSQILPPEALPCFAARTIEFGIPHIPGLSERFLYSNDDMFFARPVLPGFFYADDGYPICRYIQSKVDLAREYDSAYVSSICNNARFIRDQVVPGISGSTLPGSFLHMPHHNVDAYLKSTLLEFEDRFSEEVHRNLLFPFRDCSQLQREVWSGYAQAVHKGHFRTVEHSWIKGVFKGCRRDSFQAHVGKDYLLKKFRALNPYLFCFNDNPNATEKDWIEVRAFMDARFPNASSFEKNCACS